jgi:two-component system, chemotaxis family, response regulator Rcp1
MELENNGRAMEILLVEDNPADIRLTKEALKEADREINLNVAVDGVSALQYLRATGSSSGQPRPDLILLDLNLPKKNGRQVLAELKTDPDLQTIPVVVLTTSTSDEDILDSYHLHANCYVHKPMELDRFIEVILSIQSFWYRTAVRPVV